MASPVADAYVAPSGADVYAGRYPGSSVLAGGATLADVSASGGLAGNSAPPFGVSRLAAIIGDSLTEHDFGSTPFYWHNGLQGAPLGLIANSGFSGQSTFGLISQIDNSYLLATAPGLSGLPHLGWVGLRIGTNGAQSAFTAGDNTNQRAVITKLLTYADHVIVFPVPPIGTIGGSPNGAYVADYNANWQAICGENPTQLHYIDDCADIQDVSGNTLTQFFIADRIHMNGAGGYQMALTAEAALTALFSNQAYASPLVTDPADKYSATTQWAPNPTNVGTGGTLGTGWTGTAVDGATIQNYGAGGTGVASIVAADGGDPITVPWQRLTPSTAVTDGSITLSFSTSGRTITSGDPAEFEHIFQVRFNNFTNYSDLYSQMNVPGVGSLSKRARLRWGGSIGASRRATLYEKFYRIGSGLSGSTNLRFEIAGCSTSSASMGSVDIRCVTIRG